MAEIITLQLTRSQAQALDALANNSAERLFDDKNEAKKYALEPWSMETAAVACDKLRNAVLGKESRLTWSAWLEGQQGDNG